MCVKRRVVRGVLVFLCICFTLAFPFLLDWLHGKGVFGGYPNSFSGETWFSFAGSYFPATIIGILTLYQARIIQEQERRYKELVDLHRFIPDDHAHVCRYDKDSQTIGGYDFNEVRRMLTQSGQKHMLEEWKKGYIIKCNIYNASNLEINRIVVKTIEWEINGRIYQQLHHDCIAGTVDRISHSRQEIVIFWLFNEFEKSGEEIIRCMCNESRSDFRYETSMLTINMQIIDDADETCNLKMQYRLRGLNETCRMSSIEERYYSGRSEKNECKRNFIKVYRRR